MMFKVLWKFIKLLPLLILVGGFLKGSTSLKPVFNIGGTVLTQSELKKMLKLVKRHYARKLLDKDPEPLMSNDEFPVVVRKKYYSKMSYLMRKFIDHSGDLANDLWDNPFKLLYDLEHNVVYAASAGPDLEWDTKDDIKVPFNLPAIPKNLSKGKAGRNIARKGRPSSKKLRKRRVRKRRKPREYEYDEAGYDRYGFDRQGFDRDGFDKKGFDLDGFNRDGFDHEGYNRDGIHKDEMSGRDYEQDNY